MSSYLPSGIISQVGVGERHYEGGHTPEYTPPAHHDTLIRTGFRRLFHAPLGQHHWGGHVFLPGLLPGSVWTWQIDDGPEKRIGSQGSIRHNITGPGKHVLRVTDGHDNVCEVAYGSPAKGRVIWWCADAGWTRRVFCRFIPEG